MLTYRETVYATPIGNDLEIGYSQFATHFTEDYHALSITDVHFCGEDVDIEEVIPKLHGYIRSVKIGSSQITPTSYIILWDLIQRSLCDVVVIKVRGAFDKQSLLYVTYGFSAEKSSDPFEVWEQILEKCK